MAIEVMNELVKQRPQLHFMVAGPMSHDIQKLFAAATFQFSLLGEIKAQTFYPKLDILLHPAINEPYGMVITEALSAGVPVVISDVCGASSEVTPQRGTALPLTSPIEAWAQEIHQWLNEEELHVQYQHSWHDTATFYTKLYKTLKKQTSHI